MMRDNPVMPQHSCQSTKLRATEGAERMGQSAEAKRQGNSGLDHQLDLLSASTSTHQILALDPVYLAPLSFTSLRKDPITHL